MGWHGHAAEGIAVRSVRPSCPPKPRGGEGGSRTLVNSPTVFSGPISFAGDVALIIWPSDSNGGALPANEALRIVRQTIEALEATHEKGWSERMYREESDNDSVLRLT